MKKYPLMGKSLAVGIILLFVGTSIIPSTAQKIEKPHQTASKGTWLYVGGSGPGNYSHIQDAVNNAVNGDTVFVYHNSSPYYENINIRTSIHLLGENCTTTIIDATHQGYAIIISANNVSCSGFTICNGTLEGFATAGILLNSSCNLITDNILTKNDNGLEVSNSCCQLSWANTIQRNRFLDNDNDGITIYHSYDDNTIDDNEFIGNTNAISIMESTNITIYNNRFQANKIGVYLFESSTANLTSNSFMGDGVVIFGDALEYWNTHTMQNNTINNAPLCYIKNTSNPVVPSDAGTILLANCTHCFLQNRTITHTHHGIQLGFCYENLIIGTTVQQTTFGISLTHSSNNSIEHCQLLNNFDGLDLWAYCTNTAITNCTFSGNQYEGLDCMYEINNLLIANCTAHDNLFGINTFSNQVMVVNCTVFRNDIGIMEEGKGNVIAGCIATGNRIGFLASGDNNSVKACLAIGNQDYGAYFYQATASQITRCLLAENNQSGIFLLESIGNSITHCICSDNGIYGGIDLYGSTSNFVSLNNLTGNAVGINPSHSNDNNISSNNFIGNTRDVVFKTISITNTKQHWQGNYWDAPRRLPKLIIGTFFITKIIKIPFFNVDWHPAQQPYDIR